ncbi:MAG TPA: hypothetical protein VI056_04080 [Candidatus Limnocylindria bacterium]
MATTLRLETVRRAAFDRRLERLGSCRLTRAARDTYLEIDRGIDEVTYELALAGVRVTRCLALPAKAAGLRPAIAFDLTPLGDGLQAIDVVDVRAVPLSEATAVLLRRRVPWMRAPRHSREACRRLLREDDAVLGWRRIVWCSLASLRAARARIRLRPVVFDGAALADRGHEWTYVNDGAIERWAFA